MVLFARQSPMSDFTRDDKPVVGPDGETDSIRLDIERTIEPVRERAGVAELWQLCAITLEVKTQ